MANSRNSASPDSLPLPVVDAAAVAMRRHLFFSANSLRVVVGLSGGRDSVALLSVLKTLQPDFGYTLSACHVHHGLSPHADDWYAFCVALCEQFSVPLSMVKVQVPRLSTEGLEAAARRLRYEAYARLDADWLMLGQHQDDQAETLLFNLLRGAGLAGASGMPETRPIRPGLNLLRPLLGVSRSQIDLYLNEKGIGWVEDESNKDERYSRNFLRRQILPALQERFPAASSRLATTAAHLAEAQDLLDELARMDLAGHPLETPLSVKRLAALPEARGRNALRYWLAAHQVMIPSTVRLQEALRQLCNAAPDRHPRIVFGPWQLTRERGCVVLSAKSGPKMDVKEAKETRAFVERDSD